MLFSIKDQFRLFRMQSGKRATTAQRLSASKITSDGMMELTFDKLLTAQRLSASKIESWGHNQYKITLVSNAQRLPSIKDLFGYYELEIAIHLESSGGGT